MPTSPEFQRLHRRAGIERFAGLPPRFERSEPGWLFRRRGYGPAIRVSDGVIFPRLDGHDGSASHALLGLFGCQIPEGRVHAVSIN